MITFDIITFFFTFEPIAQLVGKVGNKKEVSLPDIRHQ